MPPVSTLRRASASWRLLPLLFGVPLLAMAATPGLAEPPAIAGIPIDFLLFGATLIGDGPSVLTRVKGIGNDMALDEGVGICGKGGQSVPAGVGQPTLLIDGLTVGGTAA